MPLITDRQMREEELTNGKPREISRTELLHRIALLIDAECGGASSVLASRATLPPEVAAQLHSGDERALTVETMLAILYAFPAHAHWLVTGTNSRE